VFEGQLTPCCLVQVHRCSGILLTNLESSSWQTLASLRSGIVSKRSTFIGTPTEGWPRS
jgi:hypothetical protein